MLSCRITQLRRNCGMNQQQLAENLHLSPSTIGMYEQGRRTPSIDILIQMSKLFSVSLDYLLTGSEFTPSSANNRKSTTPIHAPCQNCCCQKILDIFQEKMSPSEQQQT